MLKALRLNGRMVPVPVPITQLGQALGWLQDSLLRKEEVITRVILDGQESAPMTTGLREDSALEVRADAPLELANQSLEALRNMLAAIQPLLKPVAVACWRVVHEKKKAPEIQDLLEDLDLLVNLALHADSIVGDEYRSVLQYLVEKLGKDLKSLRKHAERREWELVSSVLLNEVEHLCREIFDETDQMQIHITRRMSESPFLSPP